MKIRDILEAQLQQLGAKKVTPKIHPNASRWGSKYIAYTSLSGATHLFIFLGANGAVRTGSAPAFSTSAPFLRDKLLARHTAQQAAAAKRPKPVLIFGTVDDLGL